MNKSLSIITSRKKKTYLYLFIMSILGTLIVTSIIYVINTYWYQASKETRYEGVSKLLYNSLTNINENNINVYSIKVKKLLEKSEQKVLVQLYYNKKIIKLQNKTLEEYPHSNYFTDNREYKVFFKGKGYTAKYTYKKRLGNTLLKDLLVAISFAYSANNKIWWEKRLYKKSLVFYSYFVLILSVILLFAYVYNRKIYTLQKSQQEIDELLERYQFSLNYELSMKEKSYEKLLIQMELDYKKKLSTIKGLTLDNEAKRDVKNEYLISQIDKKYKKKLSTIEDSRLKNEKKRDAENEYYISQIEQEYKNKLSNAKKKYENDSIKKNITQNEPLIEKVKSINGIEHKMELEDALESAKETIYILSGWISANVLDETMLKRFQFALERGVNIYVGFGFDSTSGKCNELYMKKIQLNALSKLRKLQEQYKDKANKGKMYLGHFPTHQKIVLKDNAYIICGSHNWLSNSSYEKYETSIKVYSKNLISSEKKRIRKAIMLHEISDCLESAV